MRAIRIRDSFGVGLACWVSAAAVAQAPVGSAGQPPEVVPPTRAEWAIAPEGTTLPGGTVLQEGMMLPPGTLLPGGAILPAGPTPAASEGTAVPAPVPSPDSAPSQSPSAAQEWPVPPAPDAAPDAVGGRRLPGQSTLGVPHISGGIGASEREEMERVKSSYNLRLLFAVAGSGAYLSNIRVQIRDGAGPVLLSTVTVGPWLYADLAPGRYDLTVEHAGRIQERSVLVPATGAAAESFYWPAQ